MQTFRSWSLRALSLGFLFGALNCGPHGTTETADGDSVGEGESEAIGTAQQHVMALPPRCYGKMLKPTPLDLEQPMGQPMTIRINRTCLQGAPLVARKIKVVLRRYELNGTIGPQVTLVDWSDWPGSQYRFEAPWTAGATLANGTLTPGRYQMYSYTVNASLMDAWMAGDPYARNMSTRSDNTYVVLKDPGTWSSSTWGACSATCASGTQTRTNSCVDGSNNALDARFCLAAEPSTSQACSGSCSGIYTSAAWSGRKIYRMTPTGSTAEVGASSDWNDVLGGGNGSLVRYSTTKIEVLDPVTLQATSTINLSQGWVETGGIAVTGSGYFIGESHGPLKSVAPDGTITPIGNMGFRHKALAWDPSTSTLYSCATWDRNLRKISTANASTLSSVSLTSSHGTINGCTGLAWAGNNTMYGLFKYDGDWRRRLGSVDVTTGVVTDISTTPDWTRGLAAL